MHFVRAMFLLEFLGESLFPVLGATHIPWLMAALL